MSERRNVVIDAISNSDRSLDPLIRIEQLLVAREYLDLKIEEAVLEARSERRAKETVYDHVNGETRENVRFGLATWDEIGHALGISRQAAWRKYGRA